VGGMKISSKDRKGIRPNKKMGEIQIKLQKFFAPHPRKLLLCEILSSLAAIH